MGPRNPNSSQSAGFVPGNIQDFWKSASTSSSSATSEANRSHDQSNKQSVASTVPMPAGHPAYHASELGPWCAVISYEACVRLCVKHWFLGNSEARAFLENECSLLQTAFGLEQNLLQPEAELLSRRASLSQLADGVFKKPQKTSGKLKVQVKKVKMFLDKPGGCTFSSIKSPSTLTLKRFNSRLSGMKSTVHSEWEARKRVQVAPKISSNGSLSDQCLAYLHVGTHYLKDMAGILKVGITSLHNASIPPEPAEETYLCSLRLKSSADADMTRMQPGSCQTHVFLPDGMRDDLIIEVTNSKGKYCGQVIAQMADIADDPGDKLRWWPIYHEPEHEHVGSIQLNIQYSTSIDESNVKCGIVAETIAYDLVLEAAMKAQKFQQKNLLLRGPWRWLVTKYATYYGVSDAYAKLRYLSYVMDVATPTAECLNVVHDLLSPVMTSKQKGTLSSQENRMLAMLSDQIEQTIALVFENYKSLDEHSSSGLTEKPTNVSGFISPALKPALKLYNLLHDIQSPEAQLQLCKYFQTAVRKILGRHLAESNEFVSGSSEKSTVDPTVYSNAYQKMKSLCLNFRNEILSDIKINKQNVLPGFVDLPNLSSALYSLELSKRMRGFLTLCPPIDLSPPVTDLIITTCDLQKDLAYWNISPVKGGVDAKELFHAYISRLIHDKHLELLKSCNDKEPQISTPIFVDDMYQQLKESLGEFQVIITQWPEYALDLEKVIADTEKVIMETLEKTYSEMLSTLKENTIPVKAVKYVQRFAKGNPLPYSFPEELGTLFNSMKKMLDVLHPEVENQFKSQSLSIRQSEQSVAGELLSEVTVMLRNKFRNYMQAAVEKLAGNTRLQNATNLKKVIQEAKESVGESDIRNRMQPIKDILTKIISDLHGSLETPVFINFSRALWDRMGQDMLRVLEKRKETWTYKASRVALSVLNETFKSEMQRVVGQTRHCKDLEAPGSIVEVQSILCN